MWIEIGVSLIQTLKGTFCVCMWQQAGIWCPGNETGLWYVKQISKHVLKKLSRMLSAYQTTIGKVEKLQAFFDIL